MLASGKNTFFSTKLSMSASILDKCPYSLVICLIHGRLKEKRIPLPACSYHAIRTAFSKKDGDFTGYEDLQ